MEASKNIPFHPDWLPITLNLSSLHECNMQHVGPVLDLESCSDLKRYLLTFCPRCQTISKIMEPLWITREHSPIPRKLVLIYTL